MAYGKEQLRKAGEAIRSFDDSYSAKIREMYKGKGGVAGVAMGFMGGHPSFRKGEVKDAPGGQVGRAIAEYSLPAINAVPKYVLPAAGVTLAGKGLYDLATQFGGAADYPEPNQLSM